MSTISCPVTILAGATPHNVGSSYLLRFKDNKWGLREVNFTRSHSKGQSHDLIWACLMAEPGLTTVCHSASPHPRSSCPSCYQSQKWARLQIPPFLQLMQILTSDCTRFRDSLGFNPQSSSGLCPVPRILYCRGRNHAVQSLLAALLYEALLVHFWVPPSTRNSDGGMTREMAGWSTI